MKCLIKAYTPKEEELITLGFLKQEDGLYIKEVNKHKITIITSKKDLVLPVFIYINWLHESYDMFNPYGHKHYEGNIRNIKDLILILDLIFEGEDWRDENSNKSKE